MRLLTIDETKKMLNVDKRTLQRWDSKGKFKALRTVGGHRRYREDDVEAMMGKEIRAEGNTDAVAVYCRVSSHEQKQEGSLDRQKGRLLDYCLKKKYSVGYVFEEVGSGLNDRRSKILKIMSLAKERKISKVVVEYKDRLTRFNKNFVIAYFKSHDVQVEWIGEELPKTFENELVEDMLSLLASFSSKIYGRRSAANRKRNNYEDNKVNKV